MSRIGRQKIEVPENVDIDISDSEISVSGPKGELQRGVHHLVNIEINDGEISVDVENKDNKKERALWGTFSAHVQNMVEGVTEGFKKELEINGVGYRVKMKGNDVEVEAGFSEPVVYDIPENIDASVDGKKIIIEGFDKELVGKVASEIRAIRPPEPYKGKGIKYVDETIRRKEGKTASAEEM